MSVPNFGQDHYRGGYSTSGGTLSTEELRIASSTFANYISGTILLVFLIFVSFMIVSSVTLILMGYARYLSRRIPGPGFYNPSPMVSRSYPQKSNGTFSQTTLPRSEYSSLGIQKHRQLSTAMSQNTIGSQRSVTATSTIL